MPAGMIPLPLAGALAAPLAGVLLYRWSHRRPGAARVVDGVMLALVPGLVAWQVLPHAWAEHGAATLAVLAAGAGAPVLVERTSRALAPHVDDLALVVGLSGLGLHALLDGAALAPGTGVAAAVILHRIPVGLAIWWMLRPRHGVRGGVLGIGVLTAATVIGYAVGGELAGGHGPGVDLYQAFVGGSLLHVVFHQSRRDHRH